jgi:hypothetical protein
LTELSLNFQGVVDSSTSATQLYSDFENAVRNPPVSNSTVSAVDPVVNVQVDLQGMAQTTTCPATTGNGADTLYFPGDTQIFLNTTGFGLSGGLSGPNQLLIAGAYSTTPGAANVFLDQADFQVSNAFVDVAGLNSSGASIGGFLDSNQTKSYYYSLGFAIQDLAAFVDVAVSPTPGNCIIENVQATQINGFLNKNACFIANAAFEDTNASPVQMLREFRDAFLVHHAWGRSFVRWYYHWSPPAAQWLGRHRVFRPLVLTLLLPVEAVAWSFLHPAGFFLMLCLLSFAVFCASSIVYSRSQRKLAGFEDSQE